MTDNRSARDRFLAPTGLMAPSQTRLVLSAITGDRVWKERVEFWKGVYGEQLHIRPPILTSGFDMTAMNSVYFDEGLVEYVDEKEVVTDGFVVRVGHVSTRYRATLNLRTSTRTRRHQSRSTSTRHSP